MTLCRERPGHRSVDQSCYKLSRDVSRPHTVHEVEQNGAKHDAAILRTRPGADRRRVVTPVDACELAAFAEAVERVEHSRTRLSHLDGDVPAALDVFALLRSSLFLGKNAGGHKSDGGRRSNRSPCRIPQQLPTVDCTRHSSPPLI